MKRFAHESVLAAHGGQARGEFVIDEAAEQRDDPAGNPSRTDEERGDDELGEQISIDEDSRADDAANHGNGRAEQAEMVCQAARRRGRDLSGGHRCEPALEPTFFFSSRRRHTRWTGDWSSDVCSSDLTISTALNGKYVKISDSCGAVSFSSATGSANLGGVNGNHDCTTGGGGAGNTSAARSRSEERRVGKEWRCRGVAGN